MSLQLPATATIDETAGLALALPAAVAGGGEPMRVDARALQAFDTSAIALLLQARRLAQAAGRGFEVVGAPPKLAELARLYGVEALLSLAPAPTPDGA